MIKKIIVIFLCNVFFALFLPGQCPDRNVLWKRILFLRDSSDIPLNNQLAELKPYIDKIKNCPYRNDSTHALLLQRIGGLYLLQKDYVSGINYINQAIEIVNAGSDKPYINRSFLVRCYYNLQLCYDSLKQESKRRETLDSCVSISLQLNTGYEYAIPLLYAKVEQLFAIGDYYRCINYATIGQKIATENANSIYRAAWYTSYFALWKLNSLLYLKQFEEAYRLLNSNTAINIAEGDADSMSTIYGLHAKMAVIKEDTKNALFYYNKYFRYNFKIKNRPGCAGAMNNIGINVYFKLLRQYDKAIEYYFRALQYADSTESLNICDNIANAYVQKGRFDSAIFFFQKAFDYYKPGITETGVLQNFENSWKGKSIEYLTGLILDKADAYLSLHKATRQPQAISHAIRIYKVADMLFDKVKTPQTDNSRLFWRANNRRLYEHAIEACYLGNKPDDAFYFFEKSRAVLLNDQLKKQRWLANKDILKLAQVKKELLQLTRDKNAPGDSSEKYRNIQQDIMMHEQELDHLEQLIKQRNPLYYQSFLDTTLPGLKDVRTKLLNDHHALLEIFNGDSTVYTLLVTPGNTYFNTINKKSFDSIVDQYLRYIADPALLNRQFDNYRKTAYQLYQLLFGNNPVPAGRIIISPDGRYFPFEALVTNAISGPPAYFLNDHAVSYTYSANYLMNDFSQSTSRYKKSFMGVAPVNFPATSGLSTLNGSDLSLQNIESYFRDPLNLTGVGASRKNFLQQFSSCQVIQLYAHASDSSNNGEPVIYFADSALYLSDLIPEDKPATRLIVLSACETGIGKLYQGEGIFSFNRGFASLGIPASVTNLWDIDNKSTYRLTELFYKYLSQKDPPDIALKNAKLEFIRTAPGTERLPYYWGATILAGKTDMIEYAKPFNRAIFFIAAGITLALLVALIFRIKLSRLFS